MYVRRVLLDVSDGVKAHPSFYNSKLICVQEMLSSPFILENIDGKKWCVTDYIFNLENGLDWIVSKTTNF